MLAASQIGLSAQRLLHPGAMLIRRAAFSTALHFVSTTGELLVLAGDDIAAPWALNVPELPVAALGRGALARLHVDPAQPQRLCLGNLAIDIGAARLWRSPPLVARASGEQIATALRHSDLPISAPGLAGCRAEALLAQLAGALGAAEPTALAAACAPLVGLGRGLSPAGDDLLTGLLGTLALAGRPCPPLPLLRRTTLLGSTQLAHAAAGALIEPLHALLAAMLAGSPAPAGALNRLLALGHSSGADMLAGARLALAALSAPRPEP